LLTVFTVTSLEDAPIATPGTLRRAISDANGSPGADVIQFHPNLSGAIDLSIVGDTSEGPSALLVSSDITVRGNAAGITIARDATASEMRLFRVAANRSLTLESIALRGGIARGAADSDGRGGAIFNQGTLNVVASTIYDNQASGGDAVAGAFSGQGLGGAIYNDGGDVSLENATLSGNVAQSGSGPSVPSSFGAGVYTRNGSLAIYNSTITHSTASTGRGVTAVNTGATLAIQIYSSIIAEVDAPSFVTDLLIDSPTEYDTTVVGANNLIRRQTTYNEITVSTDAPLLGELANNGGPTLTHALDSDSPAVHAGVNPRSLDTDQRGGSYARVVGDQADIGAFELQTAVGPDLPGDYNDDNTVDAADYVDWRKTYGSQVAAFAGADGDGNGTIDDPDYIVWQANFGTTGSGAAAAIPSPLNDDVAAAENPSARAMAFDSLPSWPLIHSKFPSHHRKRGALTTSGSRLGDRAYDMALLDVLGDHDEITSSELIERCVIRSASKVERPFANASLTCETPWFSVESPLARLICGAASV
jgi:hypothetical protein